MSNYGKWAAILGTVVLLIAAGFFLYNVRGILPPFIIAFAAAWLLDPVLDKLQKQGCSRLVAVVGVYAVFLLVFVVGLAFLIPALGVQAKQLGNDIPTYTTEFSAYTKDLAETHQLEISRWKLPTSMQDAIGSYGKSITTAAKSGIQHIGSILAASLNWVLWLVLIPIIAFYLLNDIDSIRAKVSMLIPDRERERTVGMLAKVGSVFSNYIRGMVIVCTLYGVATGILLSVLHVKYGVILGLVAGILYAVPYVGALATTITVFLVAWATHTHSSYAIWVAPVALICLNQVFDLHISPKILGKSVGLHPVLSLFAIVSVATRPRAHEGSA
jgi:predicted PurR-regulated permease PerM